MTYHLEHISQCIFNEMLVIRAGINKMLVRIANKEDPDQTASSYAVFCWSALFILKPFWQTPSV